MKAQSSEMNFVQKIDELISRLFSIDDGLIKESFVEFSSSYSEMGEEKPDMAIDLNDDEKGGTRGISIKLSSFVIF